MSYNNPALDSGIWVFKNTVDSKEATAKEIDNALVSRAKAGDVAAYRQLVERYQGKVHSVAMGVVGNYQDAEDIAQDAFVKAFRNLASFRQQSSFYTWIYRITYNLAIDERRKKYRHVESSSGDMATLDRTMAKDEDRAAELLSRQPRPDDAYHRGELRGEIKRAMDELSAEHRAVIVLREVEGLSYDEISKVTKCSKGTVMSRLHYARKRLKKILEGRLADDADAGNADLESSAQSQGGNL